jgi:cell division protein ZapE
VIKQGAAGLPLLLDTPESPLQTRVIMPAYPQSVTQLYEQSLAERGYKADEAQRKGIAALQRCQDEWANYKAKRSNALTKMLRYPDLPKGVYMYGGVGRGKSFIMDCFYNAVPLERKTRLHFHEFMREVHRQLHELKGQQDPLEVLAKRMSRKHRLICFDEFHVADVTDAMILYKLLDAMFRNRMSIVTTSNFHPDGLYPNGLHRDRILPAIELLKSQLEVINVDSGTDYRRLTLELARLYLTPLNDQTDAEMGAIFEQLAESADEDPALNIEHRVLQARRRAGGVVWFDFQTLCGGPRSQNDYLELASRFHTVMLSNVPHMPVRLASEARRFTWLVDVMYDRRCKLVVSAEVPPEALYTEGPMAHEFPRTVSRLNEMQSKEYLSEERRVVDTSLT